ncbi:hypothetical protein EMN47_00610 [Prolixibacteraceae bacterium JC049]|nr:hypothetical protein [Prolixibacteraceae bacterium JC049]
MNNLPKIDPNNLEQHLNKAELVQKTAEQITKDFALFGVDFSFSGETLDAYPELLHSLAEKISVLMETDDNRLSSILYQIDIKESELFAPRHELPNHSPIEVMAHQIIFRELKKVIYRQYFK